MNLNVFSKQRSGMLDVGLTNIQQKKPSTTIFIRQNIKENQKLINSHHKKT